MSNNIDFFMITESWLGPHDMVSLKAATPPDFSCLDVPRLSSRGGGLAVIYRNDFKCTLVDFGSFSSFEILAFLIKGKIPLLCILIYRPPKLPGFIDEFSELLSVIMAQYERVLCIGDYNVHVCCASSSPLASDFINLYESGPISKGSDP